MTRVSHPLDRLGDFCRRQAEELELRKALERKRRVRRRTRAVVHATSGALVVAAALGPLSVVLKQGEEQRPPAASLRKGVIASAAAGPPQVPQLAFVDRYRFAAERPLVDRTITNERAALLATAGSRLPATIEPLRDTLELPVAYALAPDAELATTTADPGPTLASGPAVLLTDLPAGTVVSHGMPLAPDGWIFALPDLASVDVTLPDGSNEPIHAKVAIAPMLATSDGEVISGTVLDPRRDKTGAKKPSRNDRQVNRRSAKSAAAGKYPRRPPAMAPEPPPILHVDPRVEPFGLRFF